MATRIWARRAADADRSRAHATSALDSPSRASAAGRTKNRLSILSLSVKPRVCSAAIRVIGVAIATASRAWAAFRAARALTSLGRANSLLSDLIGSLS
jgi:hypothetical protein